MRRCVSRVLFIISLAFIFSLLLCTAAFADFGTEANINSYIRCGDGNVTAWNDESCRPAVNATDIELAGIYIYAPSGYYVYSAELNGIDILPYALASVSSTDIIVPAITFTYNEFYGAPVHLVSGEEQNLDITYAPIVEDTDIIVTYTAGVNELPISLQDQHAFEAENGVHIIKGLGQEFAAATPSGWMPGTMKLIYPNGSSVDVCSGQRITPYQSCTIQIVYVLPVTVSVRSDLSAAYGDELPTGSDAFTYAVGGYSDYSDISVEADVSYASANVGRNHVYLENVRVLKNGKELNSNELRLTVYDGGINIYRTPLTITANSAEKIYDGTPLYESGFSADNLKNGDYIDSVCMNSSITTVGSTENTIYGAVIKNGDTVVSGNYDVAYVSGTLSVTPASVSISAKDSTVTYNGHSQTANDFNIVGSIAEGDRLVVKSSGSAAYVSDGAVTSIPSSAAIYNANGQDVSRCYDISLDTETPGSIRVVPRPITIIAESTSCFYTGAPISAENCGAYVSEDTPLADTDYLADAVTSGELTFVGDTAVTVSNAHIYANGEDVTDNYSITYNPGKLSVVCAPEKGTVVINLGGTKVYDGTPLENAFEWSADERAAADVTDVRVEGTSIGPAVCSHEITADNAVVVLSGEEGTLDNADYNIVINGGTVSITAQKLKISPTDTQKKYDGKPYIGSISREGTLSSGLKVNVSANTYPYSGDTLVSGTAVGSYTLRIDPNSVKVLDENGKNISSNFIISYDEAVLKVSTNITTANYSRSHGGTVTINCAVSPSELSAVTIDGVSLTKGTDFSVASGSATVITFVNAYLKDLSVGNHTLTLVYENAGSISTTISVSEAGKTTSSAITFTLKR